MFVIGFSFVLTHASHRFWFSFSPFFLAWPFAVSGCLRKSWKAQLRVFLPPRALDEPFAHNMWNPMMELLFQVQIGGTFEPFVDEIDLARIALSCHFALDLLCYKEGAHDSAWRFIGHHCPWSVSVVVLHHCHPPWRRDIELLVPGAFYLSTTTARVFHHFYGRQRFSLGFFPGPIESFV